jgi:AAA domain
MAAILSDETLALRLHRPDRTGDVRYTTPEVRRAEERLIGMVRAGAESGMGILDPRGVEEALALRPKLSEGDGQQARALRGIASSPALVSTVLGAGGSGKTTFLEAYGQEAARQGRHVVGAAFTGIEAVNLQNETGIRSSTVHSLLLDWEQHRMPPGAIVVLDEAHQLDRDLFARVVELAARDQTTVRAVIDPKQIGTIDSPSPLRMLHELTPEDQRLELTKNWRQRDPVEREAVQRLRDGDTAEAIRIYQERGQIRRLPDAAAARREALDLWWDARDRGTAIMQARRNEDVALLNDLARRRLVEAGAISGPVVMHGDQPYQAGDVVMCLRNRYWRDLDVRNGQVGTVVEADPETRRLQVDFDGEVKTIPLGRYPEITRGWARTVHKAEGLTVDSQVTTGHPGMRHPDVYTAMTRGRDGNYYITIDREEPVDLDGTADGPARRRDPDQVLAAQWRRLDDRPLSVEFDAETEAPLARTPGSDRDPAVDASDHAATGHSAAATDGGAGSPVAPATDADRPETVRHPDGALAETAQAHSSGTPPHEPPPLPTTPPWVSSQRGATAAQEHATPSQRAADRIGTRGRIHTGEDPAGARTAAATLAPQAEPEEPTHHFAALHVTRDDQPSPSMEQGNRAPALRTETHADPEPDQKQRASTMEVETAPNRAVHLGSEQSQAETDAGDRQHGDEDAHRSNEAQPDDDDGRREGQPCHEMRPSVCLDEPEPETWSSVTPADHAELHCSDNEPEL